MYEYKYYNELVKPINYTLITPAATEPLTVDEVKEYLRINAADTTFDAELTNLIIVARDKAEKITGRDLLNKTYKTYLDCFPSSCQGIQIGKSKLQSITLIQYLLDDVLTTFDSSKYYITDKQQFAEIWLVDGESYPTDTDDRKQAVEITFVAGYGSSADDVPECIKQAMKSHINLLFENRGDCPDDSGISKQVTQLYFPFIVTSKLFCTL